jgi:hypothetical protein
VIPVFFAIMPACTRRNALSIVAAGCRDRAERKPTAVSASPHAFVDAIARASTCRVQRPRLALLSAAQIWIAFL